MIAAALLADRREDADPAQEFQIPTGDHSGNLIHILITGAF